MKLMAETMQKRTYLGADNETWYEVPSQVRGFFEMLPVRVLTSEDERDKASVEETYRTLEVKMSVWFASNSDVDFVTDPHTGADLPPERGIAPDLVTDVWDPTEGKYLPLPEPCQIIYVERYFWPAAPVDPDGDEPPNPRASDVRRGPKT